MSERVRVAVVGLGWWGRAVLAQLRDSDRVDVVAGVDPDPVAAAAAQAAGVSWHQEFASVLDDPAVDAVVLCSPPRQHADQIVAAAQAGRHVFCEKPLCFDPSEAQRALDAVVAGGVVIGIGHERRFEPAVQDLRAALADGRLGTPLVVEGNFSQDKFLALERNNWRLSPVDSPIGPMAATGIHLVDLAVSFLGPAQSAWARLSDLGAGFPNGDTFTASLGFATGATAMITAVLATPFIGRLQVIGSDGWVEIRDRSHPEQPSGWDVTTSLRGAEPEHRFYPPAQTVRANIESFAAATRSGQDDYPIAFADLHSTVRAFDLIARSVRSGAVEHDNEGLCP